MDAGARTSRRIDLHHATGKGDACCGNSRMVLTASIAHCFKPEYLNFKFIKAYHRSTCLYTTCIDAIASTTNI